MIAQSAFERSTRALLERLLGPRAEAVAVERIEGAEGRDRFEVEADGGRVTLRGTSPVAVASGLHWYLRRSCRVDVSWDSLCGNGPLDLWLPAAFPPAPAVRRESPHRFRYYFNYVTFSYSLAFWDWNRWEREIDWMALHGVNLPLAVTGQEAVWKAVYSRMGLSQAEIDAFLTGPAYLPFGWMGCVDGLGGPLPDRWIDAHVDLQKQILARERELGMTPVLQAFTGHVPAAFRRVRPDGTYHDLEWAGFSRTTLLDPQDPLFREIAAAFIKEQTALFGTDHFYAADPFIEMTPPSSDPGYLREMASAIFDGMRRADPQAVWVMQGWIFHYRRRFWQPKQVDAFLGALPSDGVIVLDLYAEDYPTWRRTDAFGGKQWLWCMVHNFGGRPGIYGKLAAIAEGPVAALQDPGRGRLSGIGITTEAIENNPVVYELMTEMAWHDRPVDLKAWLREHIASRYGSEVREALEAWELLRRSLYAVDQHRPFPSIISARPYLTPRQTALKPLPVYYDTPTLLEAWEKLLACAGALAGRTAYRRDLVDLGRQVLSDFAGMIHEDMVGAYRREDLHGFSKLGALLLKVIGDVDRLVGTIESLRLSTWLENARRWGETEEERQLLEWNARNLITLWGPPKSRLFDYSYRHWSGLIRTFYLPRWRMWIEWVEAALRAGEAVDEKALEARLIEWEASWVNGGGGGSAGADNAAAPGGEGAGGAERAAAPGDDRAGCAEAPGDPVAVSQALYATYGPIVARRAAQVSGQEPAWIDGIEALA